MRRALVAGLSLWLALAAPAGARERPSSLIVEDAYLQALADFGAGAQARAVSGIVALERTFSPACIRAIELRTAEELAGRDPESLVVQAFLRVAVRHARYQAHAAAGHLYRFEDFSVAGLRRLGALYLETSRRSDAPTVVADLYTLMAHGLTALRSPARLEAARALLKEALALDPSHRAARHALAVSLELLDRPARSLEHLEQLLESAPWDARLRVRRAVVTVKAGRSERGRQLLEELASDGPIWARQLATQELARLLIAAGREGEAEDLLRSALLELPREKLSLQLAALLDPSWIDSWQVLDTWLAELHHDSGPSPRWVYEGGADEEIDALRLELGSKVAERSEGLERALIRLPNLEDPYRKKVAMCE